MIISIVRFAIVSGAVLVGVSSTRTTAQCIEEQKLVASEPEPSGIRTVNFGLSVSISGDTMIVGAAVDSCAAGSECGSAYVFRFNGTNWIESQKLTASDAGRTQFGHSVSISGDTAVIGARFDYCAAGFACGSAYIYRFDGTTWFEQQKLFASDGAFYDLFGKAVSIHGDIAVVGASGDNCPYGESCGAVYVFRYNGFAWIEEQKLIASNRRNASFGKEVSVNGDTIVIGGSGRMFVFHFDGINWVEQNIISSIPIYNSSIGKSATVDGDTIVVGASGRAYVFNFDGVNWVEKQKLPESDILSGLFGRSVSLSGDKLLIGAHGDACATGNYCVSVYLYHYDGDRWIEVQKLTVSDSTNNQFGLSVSLSGDNAVIGAPGDDCKAGDACGSVYMFSCLLEPDNVDLDIKPGSCPNPVNRKSRGVVPIAIVGRSDFDVSTIDLNSLMLSRVDGIGVSVPPMYGSKGHGIVIEDVSTMLQEESCSCHDLSGDGIDDLLLKFSTPVLVDALRLNNLARDETIELTLHGSLLDGTEFVGVDCIKVKGKSRSWDRIRNLEKTR